MLKHECPNDDHEECTQRAMTRSVDLDKLERLFRSDVRIPVECYEPMLQVFALARKGQQCPVVHPTHTDLMVAPELIAEILSDKERAEMYERALQAIEKGTTEMWVRHVAREALEKAAKCQA